jgi:hypothetical protein
MDNKEYSGKYGDYTIIYQRYNEKFEAFDPEGNSITASIHLAEVEKRLDKIEKPKKEFERVPGLVPTYNTKSPCLRCTVTSIAPDGDYWITYTDSGKRAKERTVYTDTHENKKKINQITECFARRKSLENTAEDIRESLEKVKVNNE